MLTLFMIKQLLALTNVTSIQLSETVWTGMIKTNKHFRNFFDNDEWFKFPIHTRPRKRCTQIKWENQARCLGVYYGLEFVIKFLNVVCAGTIDCTFWSKWRWFSLDCNAKGLYWIALPSISQGQTGLSYMGARHQKLATGAWAWFLRSNRRWRGCQWVSRKSLGALSHN